MLPALELAYNCARHIATSLSPLEVMIGKDPFRPRDLDFIDAFPPTLTPSMTKAFKMLAERAAAHIEEAKEQQKFYADKRRRNQEFIIGYKVCRSTRSMEARGASRFQYKFIGF